jgi:hypothetical protein
MNTKQEEALREYLKEAITPLIEQVLVKKLGQAMSFAASELVQPQRTWVGLMRGVRVEGDTVVIAVKGGNDAARELCGALIEEMNR